MNQKVYGNAIMFVRVPCGATVSVRAAVSWVSPAQASYNLRAQTSRASNVTVVAAAAAAAWSQKLDGVEVVDAADARPALLSAFRTAVYHTFLAPSTWSEPLPDGARCYLGMGGGTRVLRRAPNATETRQQAYTRYVPRIERGRDFWSTKLRKDIAASDWTAIAKELEPVGKKDKGGAIMKVFGPMGLWSSSWSSKIISDKTIAMNAADSVKHPVVKQTHRHS